MKGKNKTAVVTGAARGIGRAISLALAREGFRVVLVDVEPAAETSSIIKKKGGIAHEAPVDVSDGEAVQEMVEDAFQSYGSVDLLVNNAGIIHRGTFLDIQPESWQRVMNVNLGGTFNCCRSVVPKMIQQGGGKIINVSSVAGLMGDITASPAYGTSKGAINTFTKSLARQLAKYNITVNAVAPHAIQTDMSNEWSEEKRKSIVESIPLGRLGRPEEVASAVIFLASPGADFITGEIININGGYLMD